MIVAVTGASGFIGRRLVRRHLEAGDTVRALTRGAKGAESLQCEWHVADLAGDTRLLADFVRGADVLYHCAAELREPSLMDAVNVEGTRRLIRAASGRVGRWVGLSSVGVYGPFRRGSVSEDAPQRPEGPYETSKAQADRDVIAAAAEGRFAFTLLRPSIVFGATMPNRSLLQLIDVIDRGWFFFIGRWGASANYVHVDNVVHALALCGVSAPAAGRVYNLSDWSTMEAFVGWIASHLGRRPPTMRIPEGPARLLARAGERLPRFPLTLSRVDALTSRTRYPSARIEREVGYAAPRSLEWGLGEVVQAWRAQR